MYPDWPETPADLIPLPLCDGPKLAAFDFKGPQQIEFLEYLGEGLHAHVVKVRIQGQEYALKLFRFVYDHDWYGPGQLDKNEDRGKLTLFAQYSEPFSSECRAFGRLLEAGHPDLATACYGYVLLDEAHERALADRFALEFDGNIDLAGVWNMRGRYLGERSGKPPPIRGILKALGTPGPIEDPPNLTVPSARRILRDTIKFHQLGIICLDVRRDQLIDGKLCDFSTAITVPHFLTNPDLNPQLTDRQKARMLRETFILTIGDYWDYEDVLVEALENPRQTSKLYKVPVFPGGIRGIFTGEPRLAPDPRYQLRSTSAHPDSVYTLVDPRRYNGKGQITTTGTNLKTKSRPQRQRIPLSPRPKRWYFDCSPEEATKLNATRQVHTTLECYN
ncbi:hypothetical protein F503_00585 [Ophiostoma piceae UAMH 11346]|uniref:Protein kinase domain-containing protein n=1 Tax=Ophiostoma piceae (strain UAMH 11346) TaxID=1262450 RepID=S3CMV6_OPHP1|nr:hypothetical protein F503_00585 [Ophiostoma piceae UAMH 11346]